MQDGRQAADLESGYGTELCGLHKGSEILAQAPDKPQTTEHPGFAPAQEPGHGRRLHALVPGQLLNQSGLLPHGDGAAAGIEREHQRFGLPDVGRENAYGDLSRALGLENGQSLESVDGFQAAVQMRQFHIVSVSARF